MEEFIPHYILNEQNEPIAEPDTHKWALWYKGADRHVAQNFYVGNTIQISTVFLSLAHINKNTGDWGMLYETMVFADEPILAMLQQLSETDDRSIIAVFVEALGDDPCPDIQKRYATREEAVAGHEALCAFVETCLGKGLLPVEHC